VITTDDGVRLHHEVDGAGPPLVLCHGGPGLADDLRPPAALVADVATVVRWDQRGVGRSDPVGPHTLARYDADIEAVRRHLGHGRWVVAGHSFGATLALRYALAHPERTRGLVHVAGVGTGRAWRAASRAESDRRLTIEQRERRDALAARDRTAAEEVEWRALHWLPDFAGDRAGEHATVLAERSGPICWEANRALNAEVRVLDEEEVLARCRGLDVPVLVLHGAEDTRPSWALDALVAALPDVRVEIVPRAGHRPWVEGPEAVGAALTSFLRDLPP
jgi:proline iminopeptidase